MSNKEFWRILKESMPGSKLAPAQARAQPSCSSPASWLQTNHSAQSGSRLSLGLLRVNWLKGPSPTWYLSLSAQYMLSLFVSWSQTLDGYESTVPSVCQMSG